MDKPDLLTLYTDRENVFVLLWAAARWIQKRPTSVVVADSRSTSLWGRWLRVLCPVSICAQDLSDYANDKGENLFIEREHLLDRTMRQMMTCARFDQLKTRPLTCRNAGAMNALLSRFVVDMWGHLYAAQLLAAYESGAAAAHGSIALCLSATPQKTYFRALSRGRFLVRFYPSWWMADKSLRSILKALCLPFLARGEAGIPRHGRVGVQYVQGTVHKGYGTDFDFLPHAGLPGEEIVYMLDGDDALNAEDKAFLYAQQISVADMRHYGLSDMAKHHAQAVLNSVCPAVQGVRGGVFERLFLYGVLASYAVMTTKFLTFFENAGISVFVNVADTNVDALPKMFALEHLGGVDLSFEFSATGYHAYMDCRPLGRHQYLAWGAVTESMIHDCQDKLPYPILPERIFHAGNRRFHLPMTEGQSREVSDVFSRPGQKILILDAVDTHLKLLSRRCRQAFYDAVFELVAARPDDTFIIKPQGDMHLRADQAAVMDSLVAAGRLVCIREPGLMHPFLKDVDLVIGTPIYASTVFEALSARKIAVCFDNSDWPHIMSRRFPPELLARHAPELITKVDDILSGRLSPEVRQSIAVLSREIDPFGDAQGVVRFGQYVGAWARAIDRYGHADAALPVIDTYIDWLSAPKERKAP